MSDSAGFINGVMQAPTVNEKRLVAMIDALANEKAELERQLKAVDALIDTRMRPTDLATAEQRTVYDAARARHKARHASRSAAAKE